MTDKEIYNLSADIVGHLQPIDDLPEIGSRVSFYLWTAGKSMEGDGEVFAHVKHPDQKGWGFALVKFP